MTLQLIKYNKCYYIRLVCNFKDWCVKNKCYKREEEFLKWKKYFNSHKGKSIKTIHI